MNISAENIRLIFGLKLKELRNERGYSLSTLSAKTGISKSYLNEIEKGKKYPKTEKITRLAKLFDVTYEEMISLNLNKRLSPISDLIKSNILSELPLDFFGVEPTDLLTLLSAAPTKFSAFMDAIIQIGRDHDIRVESLYFSVLRSYQEMHENYFPEIEKVAKKNYRECNIAHDSSSLKDRIEDKLTTNYKYNIVYDGIPEQEHLSSVRYIYIEGKRPTILLNGNLDHRQQLFILARELGVCTMRLSPRNNTSSWINTESFSHVLNNFKAYYFASALILDERVFTKGIVDFTKKTLFSSSEVLALMQKSQIHAEPFMLRLTNLVPRYFRYSQLFFVRYNEHIKDHVFKMTKVLHGSGLKRTSASSLEIKACQRWVALTTLTRLNDESSSHNNIEMPICTVYKVHYEESSSNYLIISVAQRMLPATDMNSCISVGFLINDRFSEKTKFLSDPNIEQHTVSFAWLSEHDGGIEDGLSKTSLIEEEKSISRINDAISTIGSSYKKVS
jgi:transcriptional regulator with XRE-family HTH domain/Zn-dependent peptidase ImmA (M78 family)